MWCSTCHQDVPAVAQTAHGRAVCARCQQPLLIKKSSAYGAKICDEGLALDDPSTAMAAAASPLDALARHSREQVRQLSRQLRRCGGHTATISSPLSALPSGRRFDIPADL